MRRSKKDWEKDTYARSVSKQPERKERFVTHSEIPLEPLYTPEDLAGFSYEKELGYPGEFPFTRGVYGSMYRSRLWTMRQYAGFGTAEETNARFHYLLHQGQTGLSVAFDLPTQTGLDSDHALAEGEVGRVGVAIDSLRDMEILFQGIDLSRVSTSMTINATAAILYSMYLALAEKQGVPPEKIRGTVQNDILKEYIARGTYIYPPEPSIRLVVDLIEYSIQHTPRWNPISISGYHIREAGANAVQEVAFTFGDARAYLEAMTTRELPLSHICRRISFFFSAHNHFFEEIAKFRCARRLWARILKDEYHIEDPRALLLRFHTQTAGSTLTYQQPEVNLIRVAFQALSAVLGGTQSLHTNAFDEALGLPSEKSALLALRTQQVLAYETGVADVIDPLGGSYFLESLTNEIEEGVRSYLREIDDMGGMLTAIETQFVQKEILKTAYEYQRALEKKTITLVGVNMFQSEEEEFHPFQPRPQAEDEQKEKLRELRRSRDNRKVTATLRTIREKAREPSTNLIPYILDAVRNLATVGEISDTLRDVFGEFEDHGFL